MLGSLVPLPSNRLDVVELPNALDVVAAMVLKHEQERTIAMQLMQDLANQVHASNAQVRVTSERVANSERLIIDLTSELQAVRDDAAASRELMCLQEADRKSLQERNAAKDLQIEDLAGRVREMAAANQGLAREARDSAQQARDSEQQARAAAREARDTQASAQAAAMQSLLERQALQRRLERDALQAQLSAKRLELEKVERDIANGPLIAGGGASGTGACVGALIAGPIGAIAGAAITGLGVGIITQYAAENSSSVASRRTEIRNEIRQIELRLLPLQ